MLKRVLLLLLLSLSFNSFGASSPSVNEKFMAIKRVPSQEIARFAQMSIRYFTDIGYNDLTTALKKIERISTKNLSSIYSKQFAKKTPFVRDLQAKKKSTKAKKIGSVYENKEPGVATVLIPVSLELESTTGKRVQKKVVRMRIVKTKYGLRVASFSLL